MFYPGILEGCIRRDSALQRNREMLARDGGAGALMRIVVPPQCRDRATPVGPWHAGGDVDAVLFVPNVQLKILSVNQYPFPIDNIAVEVEFLVVSDLNGLFAAPDDDDGGQHATDSDGESDGDEPATPGGGFGSGTDGHSSSHRHDITRLPDAPHDAPTLTRLSQRWLPSCELEAAYPMGIPLTSLRDWQRNRRTS